MKYLTCYGALFSDWGSTAVKCEDNKNIKREGRTFKKSKLAGVTMRKIIIMVINFSLSNHSCLYRRTRQ